MRNPKTTFANNATFQTSTEESHYTVLLQEIAQRLPELEWKMSGISIVPKAVLPRELFSSAVPRQPEQLLSAIKEEIERLKHLKSPLSAYYLAKKIYQKINVLVTYCSERNAAEKARGLNAYKGYLEELCTRNQYIQTTEEHIQRLSEQQNALKARLSNTSHPNELLMLTSDLGKIEKQITLAKESLSMAIL